MIDLEKMELVAKKTNFRDEDCVEYEEIDYLILEDIYVLEDYCALEDKREELEEKVIGAIKDIPGNDPQTGERNTVTGLAVEEKKKVLKNKSNSLPFTDHLPLYYRYHY